MPFAAYTSDWPDFFKGLLGILIASMVFVLADLAAQLLLRLPPFRGMSVRGRKIAGIAGVFVAAIVILAAGIDEQGPLLMSGVIVLLVSFLFAVRADRS